MAKTKHGLIKASSLSGEERAEIEALVIRCRQCEGLEPDLYVEAASSSMGAAQLLHYDQGRLVGFVSIPPEDEIELCGIVHPDHRRRGIGRALLGAAGEEARQRGARSLLLVCEATSCSGRAFVEAVGARYRFAEYRMELDPAAPRGRASDPDPLQLRSGGVEDTEALARLKAASFDDPLEESRRRVEEWLRQPEQRFYLGMRGDEPVGSLRVHTMPHASTVYFNTFGVLPEYRGRGDGRQILTAAIDLLRAENWSMIRIEVETQNRNALSLYRSCGFREIVEYRYYSLDL